MRSMIPLTMMAMVAGCTAGPPPAPVALDAKQQSRMAQLLGGKVAGPPQTCLPNWRTRDMIVIDGSTIIFRESANRVWVQKPLSPCDRLGAPSYALVTRSTVNQLCRGDISEIVDTTANFAVGSCVMGDFVPYTRPGA